MSFHVKVKVTLTQNLKMEEKILASSCSVSSYSHDPLVDVCCSSDQYFPVRSEWGHSNKKNPS